MQLQAAASAGSSTTIETRRGAFGTSVATPAEQFYIRNNLPAPDVSIIADRDAWEVSLDGVKSRCKRSVRELKAITALAYYVSRATGAEQ